MFARSLFGIFALLLAAGCALREPFVSAQGGNVAQGDTVPACCNAAPPIVPAATKPMAYWTLFSNQQQPELQTAGTPLHSKTKVTDIDGSSGNMLTDVCCVRFAKGFVWVLAAPNGSGNANELLIFRLPLTTDSTPLYYDTLEGATFDVHMEFDNHDNLWVSSVGYKRANNAVTEYAAGSFFEQGGDVTPSLTLTVGLDIPQGVAFDKNGNLYVANGASTDIAVFAQPIQNQEPYYLDGVSGPGGLAFDKHGNLYAVSSAGSKSAMVEYASTDLHSGDTPSVVDGTGLKSGPYGSDLVFDKTGNLYDADCGSTAGIYTYPLATRKLTSKTRPTFYTNQTISQNGCAWSFAIH